MDGMIYTVMSGAERALRAQQVHANNLANLETPGFRGNVEMTGHQAVAGYGYAARHMSELQSDAVSGRAGTQRDTGRELDVAVQGDGLFTVQWGGSSGDGEAYTRAGNFSLNAEGGLMLGERAVIGDGGPIVLPPHSKVSIAKDGVISIQAAGQTELQPVDRLKLVKPANGELTKNEAGLLMPRQGGALAADATVQLNAGHLESSNVSAVEEMVATMSLSRDFEMQMKLFKAADGMADAGNRLMRE